MSILDELNKPPTYAELERRLEAQRRVMGEAYQRAVDDAAKMAEQCLAAEEQLVAECARRKAEKVDYEAMLAGNVKLEARVGVLSDMVRDKAAEVNALQKSLFDVRAAGEKLLRDAAAQRAVHGDNCECGSCAHFVEFARVLRPVKVT